MKRELIWIDKTLGYALKNGLAPAHGFTAMKQKIAAMSGAIFDISLKALGSKHWEQQLDMSDVRLCIEPDVDQVKAAVTLGCPRIKLSINPSADVRSRCLLEKALAEAGKFRLKVTVGCLDLAHPVRSDMEYIGRIATVYDMESLIVHDFDSRLDPLSTYAALTAIDGITGVELEYGGKNALGLATGNTLGAIKSGIRKVAVSVGGIGGFPAFEEVLMGAYHLLKMDVAMPSNISKGCREVLAIMGLDVPKTKPVIGDNIFAHESGIHVDGVMKKSDLYEPFSPEEVGLSRKIIIGKHSGRAAIEHKVREMNIPINPSGIAPLLERVRSLAIRQKTAIVDEQLAQLAKEVVSCEGACC